MNPMNPMNPMTPPTDKSSPFTELSGNAAFTSSQTDLKKEKTIASKPDRSTPRGNPSGELGFLAMELGDDFMEPSRHKGTTNRFDPRDFSIRQLTPPEISPILYVPDYLDNNDFQLDQFHRIALTPRNRELLRLAAQPRQTDVSGDPQKIASPTSKTTPSGDVKNAHPQSTSGTPGATQRTKPTRPNESAQDDANSGKRLKAPDRPTVKRTPLEQQLAAQRAIQDRMREQQKQLASRGSAVASNNPDAVKEPTSRQRKFSEQVGEFNARISAGSGTASASARSSGAPAFSVKFNKPMSAALDRSAVHPVYQSGEKLDRRIQDYFSIALRKVLNAGQANYGHSLVEEIQMSFGDPSSAGLMQQLVISGNNAKSNSMLLSTLGIDVSAQTANDGIYTIHGHDLAAALQSVLGGARANTAKRDDDTRRRLDKLEDRFKQHISPSVSIHVPVNPQKHAELEVLDAQKKLGIPGCWEISGSKMPCVGCASDLHDAGVVVPDTSVLFPSQLPNARKLKNLIDAGTTRFGRRVALPDGTARIGNRRQSSSPGPSPR